jgi:cell division protein FtsB
MKLKDKILEIKNLTRDLDLDYQDLYEQIKSEAHQSLVDKNKALERQIQIKNDEIKTLREAMFKLTHAYVDLQRRYKNESIYQISQDDLSDRG